jgi:phosphoribosyl 1,2-cyclic phosphodiesterase
MFVKFWGVHGSLPRPGPTTLKYGGNTACVEIQCNGTLIILDAGTGIRELGEDLLKRNKNTSKSAMRGHIFFSHLHWDHVQGFPFFGPAFSRGNEFHLYGARGVDCTIFRVMVDQMSKPNFPITLDDMTASLVFHDVAPGDRIMIDKVMIQAEELNHPGGSMGYRLESMGKTIAYASDTEFVPGVDPDTLALVRDADLLIHDSMFTPEQYLGLSDDVSRQSWGHSTWEGAVETAKAAGVKQLILFHHGNDDTTVSEIERQAQEKFPSTRAAFEGLEIRL